MTEQYGFSRDTVRKTIRLLEDEGTIYSSHGRGTFVTPAVVRGAAGSIEGFSETASARGAVAGQRILSVESQPASLALAGLLNIRAGREVTRVRRVRLVDQRPVGVHDAFVVIPGAGSVERDELARLGSLYEVLRKHGVVPTVATDSLSATAADADDASLLGVEFGSPLLACERISFSDRREPIEYCLVKYVPSYRFGARITA